MCVGVTFASPASESLPPGPLNAFEALQAGLSFGLSQGRGPAFWCWRDDDGGTKTSPPPGGMIMRSAKMGKICRNHAGYRYGEKPKLCPIHAVVFRGKESENPFALCPWGFEDQCRGFKT